MPILTPWRYTVESLPPIITAGELSSVTSGRFDHIAGIDAVLAGVSAAVRNACGWHVSPVLECSCALDGGARAVALPALFVEAVEAVAERGEELPPGQYEFSSAGVVRRCGWKSWAGGYGSVSVRYRAGFDPEAVPDLMVVAAQIASNALAAPAGVRAESAGDVSITYNQTGNGIAGGVRLLESDLAMLRPYMLGEVLS